MLRKWPRLWLFICCKTKLLFFLFVWKTFVFYKIYVICRKKCFYMEKKIYREKYNKWKCKKNISYFRNIFLHRKCLCYKQNINLFKIYIHSAKKNVSDDKKIYLLKLRCELSNLVCKISEAANLWHSLNYLFPKTWRNFLKKTCEGIYS